MLHPTSRKIHTTRRGPPALLVTALPPPGRTHTKSAKVELVVGLDQRERLSELPVLCFQPPDAFGRGLQPPQQQRGV
jgi:hypothetical protein